MTGVGGLSPRVRGNRARRRAQLPGEGPIPASAGEPPSCCCAGPSIGAYPRECGGTWQAWAKHRGKPGLSPRVRGNRGQGHGRFSSKGPIPASAGEPSRSSPAAPHPWAYPRECGGTGHCRPEPGATAGLSPRVRGNLLTTVKYEYRQGPIPASAGEPRRTVQTTSGQGAYPRECGGTAGRQGLRRCGRGLSPRVRGNPRKMMAEGCCDGPIPASAGEPCALVAGNPEGRAYPRECGGTGLSSSCSAPAGGLSPRVRGNPLVVDLEAVRGGPIPASAGEPSDCARKGKSRRAYPRECGGTPRARLARRVSTGLSPRVRGNHPDPVRRAGRRGPIPASAGEPSMLRCCEAQRRAYPRECGGTDADADLLTLYPGLSPRVRGNHWNGIRPQAGIGPIPASAGEPSARP